MSITYSVSLEKLLRDFDLTPVYLPCEAKDILITSADVNRPGLQLNGFFDFFDRSRIQIIGKSEIAFLKQLGPEELACSCDKFFSYKPPVVIVSRGLEPLPDMVQASEKYKVPLVCINDATSSFMSSLISSLNVELAPRQTCHGVLVEVYGEGILLLGESGVGKSETAIELVKRGHRLIADDAVEIRRVSSRTLVGASPENIRHFVELRGVGIINARRIFGMGAVKLTERIDMVIQLELWDKKKVYDRMGMESQYTEILGISVTSTVIPVKPGRNLAIIIEVAAINNRQKKMGYNAAQELLEKVGMMEPESENSVWDQY
ncbi:MAG: HPr(Ser) kinase/phosphatase [Provencibacterium sp.]|jgi:HPr kinase/phosphorylase|nr:HPr(Ser) kinase/phosphatase [Provencibacterium sp.]